MKLGIVSVFMPKEEDTALVELYFNRLAKHTKQPYTIYCHIDRAMPKFQEQIVNQKNTSAVTIPDTPLTGYQEHSYYLTKLLTIAAKSCEYVAIFHPDSFPIVDAWDQKLIEGLCSDMPVAAIERTENNDFKPHSSFILMSADYYKANNPALIADTEDSSYQQYYAVCGHLVPDTGSGIGFDLFKNSLSWKPLRRSNKNEDHWMLGSVYADTIFHLGTATRDNKILQRDRQKSNNKKYLRKTIMPSNVQAYEKIRKNLLESDETYLKWLMGC